MIPALLLSLVFLFGVLPLSTPQSGLPMDKVFHFLAFFWIGFYVRRDQGPLRGVRGLGVYGLTGLGLEFVQGFLPQRSFEWMDFGTDLAGLLLGAVIPLSVGDIIERAVLHLGAGKIPFAPATWGSLLALGIYWFYPLPYPGMVGAVLFGLVVGWAAYHRTRDEEDPPWVVLDEALAFWAFAPLLPHTLPALFLYFFLFRLMDIVKPLGIRALESLPGGVFWDDVGAGVLAVVLARGVLSFF